MTLSRSNLSNSNALQGCTGKAILLIFFLVSSIPLMAFARWKTYTNTNHVTDIAITQTQIYSASWGGVSVYDKLTDAFDSQDDIEYSHTLTSVDGLTSNDVRTLAYEPSSRDLWVGTYNDGITILKSTGNKVLNVGSGLPSNKVRRIIVKGSYIYVATDAGISQFYYLPGISFPLLLHQYNEQNTQNGLNSNDVHDIAINTNGWLYCGTSSGISYVHTDSLDIDAAWHNWTNYNSPLSSDPILSISVNNDVLAANTFMTVHKLNMSDASPTWQSWSTEDDALADSVSTVSLSPENDIYVAYGFWNENEMSLRRHSTSTYAVISQANTLTNYTQGATKANRSEPAPSIYRFLLSPLNTIFCTWGEGTFAFSGNNQITLINDCIGFQTISEIATDHNNKSWFVGGWQGALMTRKGTRGVSSWEDGNWQTYNFQNSPLISDNMLNVAIDAKNKKWFGSWDAVFEQYGWNDGAVAFDDETGDWEWYNNDGVKVWAADSTHWSANIAGAHPIYNNTVSEIYVDKKDNIIINSSGSGMTVYNRDYEFVGNVQLPSYFSQSQAVVSIFDTGSRYFIGTYNDRGMIIWNNSQLVMDSNDYWVTPPSGMELNNCIVYGVVALTNQFGEEEDWIASSAGLIMWNGTDWYKFDTDIKTRIWKNGAWSQSLNDGATWYYYDEERIFGSVRTSPTAIFLDPFNRIWIGSQDNGFSMYNPATERFTNYYQANSPLLSNFITCFGYDSINGTLLIGTPDGLNTLEIGIETKTETKLNTVKAFPNPFYPAKDGVVRIVNVPSALESMPAGSNRCKIFDVAGALIAELTEGEFAQFTWNGNSSSGKKCSSGVYYFVVTSSEGVTKRGKFAMIQQ